MEGAVISSVIDTDTTAHFNGSLLLATLQQAVSSCTREEYVIENVIWIVLYANVLLDWYSYWSQYY